MPRPEPTASLRYVLLTFIWCLSGCGDDEAATGGDAADPCGAITCSGHGTCSVQTDGTLTCECDAGFDLENEVYCLDSSADVPTTDQVVQHGIAFTFDAPAPFGQYANGDYWVVGPLTVTAITPSFDGNHHGYEVNPSDPVAQGFDSRIADFDAARVPMLPYSAQPGDAIVKSISLEPFSDEGCRPCLQTAAVLTIVDAVPEGGGARLFRPPYFGPDRTSYSVDSIQGDVLPQLELPSSDTPSLAQISDSFRRVQLDHKVNWVGRPLHPADNMPEYGSSIAVQTAEGALRLMGPEGVEAKFDALVVYLQHGIDLYHMALGGVAWPPNGGHSEGRKLPITFASVVLGDTPMQEFVRDAGDGIFGENGGVYMSAAAGVPLFGQGPDSEERYWSNLVNDDGSRTITDPYLAIDGGHRPGGSYQFCCLAQPWKAAATAIRLMPELAPVWNDDDFLGYVERWVTLGAWTQPDTCAPPDGVCAGGDNVGAVCTSASEPTTCTGDEAVCDLTVNWDANYGITYGPDGNGGCISDTDESDGLGRFPLLHGASTDDGHYGSAFANQLWDDYVAE